MAFLKFIKHPSSTGGAGHNLGDDFSPLSLSQFSFFFSPSNILAFCCIISH